MEGLVTAEVPETWDKLTLEAHTGDITLRLALATETGEEDLVVLVDEVQATIIGDWSHVRQRLALKPPLISMAFSHLAVSWKGSSYRKQ